MLYNIILTMEGDKIISLLNTEGYFLFKNVIPKTEIEFAKKNIKGTKIKYGNLLKFIDTNMLPVVNKKLDWKLINTKYRISNNNNSSDATGLHRDIQLHKEKHIPIFTCLSYLDEEIMELIPGSHSKPVIEAHNLLKYYNKRIRLRIKPGDILLFNASMIHRGIFYKNNNPNRRLIQLFDCIPKELFRRIQPRILHLPCLDKCSSSFSGLIKYISKMEFLISIVIFINYLNVARGYGTNYNFVSKEYLGLSTEANQDRLEPKYNKDIWEDSNLYITRGDLVNNPKDKISYYFFYSQLLNSILFTIYIIVFIVIVIYLLKLSFSS